MLHIVHSAQIGIRSCTAKTGICLKLAHEQQHLASFFPVMDVALPGGRVFGGGALALPVEQALVDGIILVHGGGGVILVRFVQGHKEHVQLLFRQPFHALADGSRLQKVQRHQQLVAGIGAVQVQRTIKAHIYRLVNKINAVILILQKCLQLPQQNGTVRESIQVIENFFILPAFCSFAPESHIEHLQHPLLYRWQGCKVGVIQFR